VNVEILNILHLVCPWIKNSLDTEKLVSRREYEQVIVQLAKNFPIDQVKKSSFLVMEFLFDNKLADFEINAFPTVVEMKRPAARINISSMSGVGVINQLDKKFKQSLRACRDLDVQDLCGLIMYSAMRFGLLLRKELINEFIVQLNELPKSLNGHIWYELAIEGINNNDQIWNPDPTTLSLLNIWYEKQCHKHFIRPSKKSGFGIVKASYINLGVTWKSLKINSQGQFINAISSAISFQIPAYINDCATGAIDNRTLAPSCYYRLISGRAPALLNSIESQLPSSFKPSIRKTVGHSKIGKSDSEVYAKIKEWLGSDLSVKPSVISNKVSALILPAAGRISPTLYFLGLWVAQRLISENHWGNKTNRSSMLTKFYSVSQRLLDVFGSINPVDIGADELTDLYESAIEAGSGKEALIRNFQDYHLYLVYYHGVEDIVSGSPWGGGINKFTGVDAKIIMHNEFDAAVNEYRRLIRQLRANIPERRLMKIRLVILILGFYTGMRRREVIASRICDVTRTGKQEFLVRANMARKLKSINATRRLAIGVQIPEKHLKEINSLITFRLDHGATKGDYLFNLSEIEDIYINEKLIFEHIQFVLQSITGDPYTRFHHLRHSCGTWALWRWSSLHLKTTDDWEGVLPTFDRNQLEREYVALFGKYDESYPSEKLLYELARMLGHSSPGMSLEHYAHSVHWISSIYRAELVPELDAKTLSHIAGVSVRQVEKLGANNRYSTKTISKRCKHQLSIIASKPDLTGWRDPHKKRIGQFNRETSRERLIEFDVWQALIDKFSTGLSDSVLAEKYQIDRVRLASSASCANDIFSMRFDGAGHNTYRHREPSWGKQGQGFMLDFPRQARHLKTAESMVQNYNSLPATKRSAIDTCIKYFINNGRLKNSGLRFNRKNDLSQYLKLFDYLGLFKKGSNGRRVPAYRVSLVSSKSSNSLDRQKQWSYWLNSYDWKNYQMRDVVNKYAQQQNGYIELDYYSDAPVTVEKSSSRPPDWGYRFGLYLLAVTTQMEKNSQKISKLLVVS